jgi:hypothetical protein
LTLGLQALARARLGPDPPRGSRALPDWTAKGGCPHISSFFSQLPFFPDKPF